MDLTEPVPRSFGDRVTGSSPQAKATPLQLGAMVVGATFLLVGIAGFIPGLTTDLDGLSGAGTDSQAELLGLFAVSILHNFVHLAFGFLGFFAARTTEAARWFLIGGGVVYLLLTLYGAVIDLSESVNFVPVNTADNWLHLGLGLGMIGLGVVLGLASRTEASPHITRDDDGTLEVDLHDMTRAELYEAAQDLDIDGRSSMDKAELGEAVEQKLSTRR